MSLIRFLMPDEVTQVPLDERWTVWGLLARVIERGDTYGNVCLFKRGLAAPLILCPLAFALDAYRRRESHGLVEPLPVPLEFFPGDSFQLQTPGASALIQCELYGRLDTAITL